MNQVPSNSPQIVFLAYPDFKPFYNPQDMIEMGIFGGKMYSFAPKYDLPFTKVDEEKWYSTEYKDSVNYFKVKPAKKITINLGPNIKRQYPMGGWFEWYINFWAGKRHYENDNRMIAYWIQNCYGLTFYFRNAISYNPPAGNPSLTAFTDLAYLPDYRQALLEFSWDSTKDFQK